MSDNIIEFPKKMEFEVEFTPAMQEDEIDDIALFIQCLLNGLYVTGDIDWEAAMSACFIAAAHCAVQAGYSPEEFTHIAKSVEAHDHAD